MPEQGTSLYGSAARDGRLTLRSLRESAGLSQQELANRLVEAGLKLDQAHVQKIESGAIKHPTAPTLDAILTIGLHAPYRIRIDVLAAFGHRLRWELPSEGDIALERQMSDQELARTIWPSYLVDYAHRIWGWNRLFPRLLGNTPDDPRNEGYRGLTVLDILFNPAVGTNRQIANAGTFAPVIVGWFKAATKPFRHEPWFLDLFSRANTWPGFIEMWDLIPEGPEVLLQEPPVIPVEIQVPRITFPLQFRTIHAPVAFDPRFAILHMVPLSVETQEICAAWVAKDGVVPRDDVPA